MVYMMHAQEPRKDGSRRMELQKESVTEGILFREFSLWQARKDRRTLRHTEHVPNSEKRTDSSEEDAGPMCYPFLWVNTFDSPTGIGIKGRGT